MKQNEPCCQILISAPNTEASRHNLGAVTVFTSKYTHDGSGRVLANKRYNKQGTWQTHDYVLA
jgi:hypothetical protein